MLTPQTFARIVLLTTALAATGGAQPWKDKLIAQWNEQEARQVLTESPWAKTVTPTLDTSPSAQPRVGMGGGGIGMGGIGIGLPGMGRRGGMSGSGRVPNGNGTPDPAEMPTLTLRWASAMPVSAAELIAHEVNAPTVDPDHYAIAVYGFPSNLIAGDPASVGAELKKHAAIKREGKKEMKPSSVEVRMHDDGPVILYLFSRHDEITSKDKQLTFAAQIGRLKFAQDFFADEMVYQGRPEL
jgi:hypothetical protein